MGNAEAKANYVHYVRPAAEWVDWHKNFNFVLVENLEQLEGIFKDFVPGKTCIAFDLETSGLDPENSFIVGACLCMDGKTAYYVPINHYIDTYNMYDEGLDIIYKYLCLACKVFFFNVRYDARMMEYHGYNKEKHAKLRFMFLKYDMSKVNYFDVGVPIWLADTNIKMPSLKWSSLHFLGIKQMTFAEASGGVENFYYVDPKQATFYGASDALCTYLLVPVTFKYFKESNMAGKIDNKALYPLMHYEQERIGLDKEMLIKFDEQCKARIEELEKEIYKEVGYVFKLNSPAQVSDALQSLGIDTGGRTKTGYMKTGIDELEALPDYVLEQHPALKKIVEYKQLSKYLSSYVKVLKNESEVRGYLRCAYKTYTVPTGRLAAGKDNNNSFFSEINVQSIPKPHPMFYYVFDTGDRMYFSRAANVIAGYKFVPVQQRKNAQTGKKETIPADELQLGYGACLGIAEGFDQKLNARATFLPYVYEEEADDWIWCSVDFAAQELRLTANFSHEPVWIEAFNSGGDIHMNTAKKIWGEENYNKEKRKMAKGANFSIIYGASAQSFVGMGGMNLQEAEEFFNSYKAALPTLFAYQDRSIKRCRREGVVFTYFGRPRRVAWYYQNGSIGFANRTVLNDPIQGTAGDVLKIVMCKLWQNLLNHDDYKNDVRFLNTVHDEINYGVRKERVYDICPIIEKNQEFSLPEWPVVLKASLSLGFAWGNMFEFERTDDGYYYPKMD